MTRTVLRGATVFDGTGRDPAPDAEVDLRDRTLLPGLFDCHIHVCVSSVDLWDPSSSRSRASSSRPRGLPRRPWRRDHVGT